MSDIQKKESWEEIVKELPVEIRVALAEHASKQFLEGIKEERKRIAGEVEEYFDGLSGYCEKHCPCQPEDFGKLLAVINTPR